MKSIPVLFAILILTICLDYCACRQDASNHVGSQITSGRQHSENILPAVKAAPPVFECDYLGQTLPGEIPVKFAAGIVSTRLDDSCLEIAISGKEIVFTRDGQIIWMVQVASGIWSEPAVLSFSGGETSFSKDGAKIYFNSRAPFSGMKVPLNVWTAQKSHDSWGSPA
ncbi:hypothetical protein L0128_09220, partial [candidate division KSB1 bacterium]|nr:hypothetical protein [candidate division KSB1 bacterium]